LSAYSSIDVNKIPKLETWNVTCRIRERLKVFKCGKTGMK
jgi:hypothetical protein